MIFSDEIRQATSLSLSKNIPFCLFALPGKDDICFFGPYGKIGLSQPARLDIYGFNPADRLHDCVTTDSMSDLDLNRLRECATMPAPSIMPPHDTIKRSDYTTTLESLINRLQTNNNKVVIARTVTGDASSTDWTSVAEQYFTMFCNTFRALYYTHSTGAWLTATPEVLLNADGDQFETMSLAGTRPYSESGSTWDTKNIKEQLYVTRFITECLDKAGADYNVGTPHSLRFGSIEHLCTRISGTSAESAETLAQQLSPTPAVAGYPRDYALDEISRCENFPRNCYGGYIALTQGNRVQAFVNLRCVHFSATRYCIYAGGGITGSSNPSNEWAETEAKSASLLNLIERHTH